MKTEAEVIKFMTDNMTWIGFGNYTIAVKSVKKLEGGYASILPSEIGQQMVLTICNDFYTMPLNMQENILIHELMHGREFVRQERVEDYCRKIISDEEEKFINDCVLLAQNWSGVNE